LPMTITLDIPDDLAITLAEGQDDPSRAILEGFAVEAYQEGRLSAAEIRHLLGHASRWETENFLAARGAWPAPDKSEVAEDAKALEKFLAR